MKLIAHRGLVKGPDKILENTPKQIEFAIKEGFDCEVDIWSIDNVYYLGHDDPEYRIDKDFLSNPHLWLHAKNIEALDRLSLTSFNFFWHQNDDYTLTSHRYIWTYPGKSMSRHSIMVMPEWQNSSFSNLYDQNCYGICSDYVYNIREQMRTNENIR
jgi:hypothetical protein